MILNEFPNIHQMIIKIFPKFLDDKYIYSNSSEYVVFIKHSRNDTELKPFFSDLRILSSKVEEMKRYSINNFDMIDRLLSLEDIFINQKYETAPSFICIYDDLSALKSNLENIRESFT